MSLGAVFISEDRIVDDGRLRKLCCEPGCDEFAETGGNRCPDCQAIWGARVAARKQQAKAAAVAQAGAMFYASMRWRKARSAFLDRHPLCADCLSLGLMVEAREVDHIKPHRGDARLMWDRSNWQALCKPCHSRKTAREVFGRSRPA